ncbi:hypothetical protein ACHAWF_002102 [Thalassiosira exigua]
MEEIIEVVETEPDVKGNAAQGYTKSVLLDCGATISVPVFVKKGSQIKVDSERGGTSVLPRTIERGWILF